MSNPRKRPRDLSEKRHKGSGVVQNIRNTRRKHARKVKRSEDMGGA